MKKISYLFISSLIVASCNQSTSVKDNRKADVESTISAGGQTEKELEAELAEIRKEEEAKLLLQKKTTTTMTFDRRFHDFGDVREGVENTTTFIVTNTGDKPLIIQDVSASCGCTTPEKPEKPIPPGKSDKITVTFKAKPDQLNEQLKNVTVTANTTPQVEKLEIRAFVKK